MRSGEEEYKMCHLELLVRLSDGLLSEIVDLTTRWEECEGDKQILGITKFSVRW